MRPDTRKDAVRDAIEVMVAWRLAKERPKLSWKLCKASAQLIVSQSEHLIDPTLPLNKLNAVAAAIVEGIVIGVEIEPSAEAAE